MKLNMTKAEIVANANDRIANARYAVYSCGVLVGSGHLSHEAWAEVKEAAQKEIDRQTEIVIMHTQIKMFDC